MKLVEAYQKKQLRNIKHLYRHSFPRLERRPFYMLRKKSREGCMQILSIEDEHETFLGLAIMILYKDMALLDYFAMNPRYRGKGLGSDALQLLKQKYADKRFFLEIENPDTKCTNAAQRIRRQAFYLRNGMIILPNFMVHIFGTEMKLLTDGCSLSFQEYRELYENTFGTGFSKKIICISGKSLK